jgi:hypothetical protein
MIDEKTGIDFPLFQNQLRDVFGEPDEAGPFARNYLTQIDLSEFRNQLGHIAGFLRRGWFGIYGNYVLEGPLKKALRLLCEKGLAQELQTYDGCFNIRRMKGGSQMSVHSWALAVDFNAAENPFGGQVSFSDGLILCFAEAGFEAGALWRTPDGMHFQLPWTGDWRNSSNPMKPVPYEA